MLTTQQEYWLYNRLDAEDRERFSQMTAHEREYMAHQIWVADEVVRRNPEWPATEVNAKLLRQATEQAVAGGAAYSADTVCACLHSLTAQGKFEQPQAEVITESQEEHLQRRHIEELAKSAHEMSDAELEKALNRIAGVYVRSTI